MAKLVLDIEPSLIDKATSVAKERNISLTELTADFYRAVSTETSIEKEKERPLVLGENLSDWVKSLIAVTEPTPDFDHKKEYGDHIMKKYGR